MENNKLFMEYQAKTISEKVKILKKSLKLSQNKFWLDVCKIRLSKFYNSSLFTGETIMDFSKNGFVISIVDGVAKIYGLKTIRAGELVIRWVNNLNIFLYKYISYFWKKIVKYNKVGLKICCIICILIEMRVYYQKFIKTRDYDVFESILFVWVVKRYIIIKTSIFLV